MAFSIFGPRKVISPFSRRRWPREARSDEGSTHLSVLSRRRFTESWGSPLIRPPEPVLGPAKGRTRGAATFSRKGRRKSLLRDNLNQRCPQREGMVRLSSPRSMRTPAPGGLRTRWPLRTFPPVETFACAGAPASRAGNPSAAPGPRPCRSNRRGRA
jgi:hypothetical protein